ncbi:MAG: aminotransferase class V-fold PLP-dependent enzyme [Melioribacteraceae bacterium]|nr:aminotransferase class V-fold PLP-dependent enzyme [Melioribacteraceae bacterium]MCF8353019.1 aminotransferase class V-fold PLP-dependent enzyme [Melioribacteraceae bacterium]MCF8392910.1 aminotransferase class V-fold PLP-dependent enzyme [Melioribacteraceae bacterium]MCF8417796.1 aminotransferase class V-fold PLP-dependent enzyme [Melioribacteraceae bacterium]
MSKLEIYFEQFRNNIIGIDKKFDTPYGIKKIIYADWIASGRLFAPIEKKMVEEFGPFVGNTHTETNLTGTTMTRAYHYAQKIIKDHVNAGTEDVIITAGFGMTAVVNKFQRILGLRLCEQLKQFLNLPANKKPVVFVTHMEHHSNHTSWIETIADIIVIEPNQKGLVNYEKLEELLEEYKERELKIGAFTAASNVTGIQPDFHRMAKIMHQHNGLCFIDFAAAAPYVNINMHPEDPMEKLDAIYFSPHKFLGGPGTSGVLIFDSKLYKRKIPDHPGGGTVDWTNPWGFHKFVDNIEAREDGGTPGFLQAIRAALCIKLKEKMGVENILKREKELLKIAFERFKDIHEIHILANDEEERLGIISFYVEDIHYNLLVKLLNDRYGIQVRGGCSCAGTYGHYLLHVDPTRSKRITDKINEGDLSEKPGWIRLSLHPTMKDKELIFILDALKEIIANAKEWEKDYSYSSKTNEYTHLSESIDRNGGIHEWFNLENHSQTA